MRALVASIVCCLCAVTSLPQATAQDAEDCWNVQRLEPVADHFVVHFADCALAPVLLGIAPAQTMDLERGQPLPSPQSSRWHTDLLGVQTLTNLSLALELLASGQAWTRAEWGEDSAQFQGRLGAETLPALDALDVDALDAREGQFAALTGCVQEVARVDRRYFLNFGEDFRSDATLGLQSLVLEAWLANQDPPRALRELAGLRVEARGVIESFRGPFIELEHPSHLVVLDQAGQAC